MQTRIEKLMQEAGERLKELEKEQDKLHVVISKIDETRAQKMALINSGYGSSLDRKSHAEYVGLLQCKQEELARNRDALLSQRQYIATLADKYAALENSMSANAKNYSSTSSGFTMFPQANSQQTGTSYHDEPSVTARHDYSW